MNNLHDGNQPDCSTRASIDELTSTPPNTLQSLSEGCIFAEKIDAALFVLKPDGEVLYANPAACALVRARRSVIGRRFSLLLGGGQAKRHAMEIRRVRERGVESSVELLHVDDGEERWLRVRYTPVRDSADNLTILVVVADITAEVAGRERLKLITEERNLLYRAGAELGRSLDHNHIFTAMRSLIAERMDCDVLYLSSFDPETEWITCLFAWQDGSSLDIANFPPVKLAPEGKGTQSLVIRTGESILLTDYNAQRRTSNRSYYINKEGGAQPLSTSEVPEEDPNVPRSALIVPIKLGEVVRGVLQVFSYRLNAYSQRDLRLVEAIGAQVLVAVNNALLYRTVLQEQAKLEELNQTLEQRVIERTARLAEAQQIAHLGSLEIDVEQGVATLSEEACRILRLPLQQATLSLRQLSEFIHVDDLNHILDSYQHCGTGEMQALEVRLVRADGSNGYVSLRAKPVVQEGILMRILCTALDVTERRHAELAQRQQTAILEATTDLVANWNLRGKLTYLNQGGRRMLGVGLDADISDLSLNAIYTLEAWRVIQSEAIPTAVRRGVWVGNSTILHTEGVEIPVSQAIIAHRDGHGTVEYFSTIMRDMTLHKQAEDALRRSRDELSSANIALEKAARLKDEFLASMSHELRTPMTSILGLTEALREELYGVLNEKQLRAVNTIEQSGKHLLDLINDILDLSKIEAGQFKLNLAQCSVDEACMAALHMTRGMAQQKRQSVSFTINPTAIDIEADVRRLKQMLVNLLGNAIKFTPEGGQVGLDVEADANEGVVRFHIWDKGIGIAEENIPKLFEPFTQLDGRLSRQYSGTGLGLSLVRRMAELHGGSISLESKVGEGSRFTLSLPWRLSRAATHGGLAGGDHEDPAFASAALMGERTKHVTKVLIVDDNLSMMEMYVDYLRRTGYEVRAVDNGLTALEVLPHYHPDVILMDIQMPGLDGLEVIRRIRSRREQEFARIPIVALTALAMPGDRERCLDAGADEYLAKPVSLMRVSQLVADLAQQQF